MKEIEPVGWMVEYEWLGMDAKWHSQTTSPQAMEQDAENEGRNLHRTPRTIRNVSDPIPLYADVEGRIAELESLCRDMLGLMTVAANGVDEYGGDSSLVVEPIANRARKALKENADE